MSSTGVSASAPSIAQARPRAVGATIAAAASAAAITIPIARTASGPTAVSTSTGISERADLRLGAAQDVGDVARELLHGHRALLQLRAPLRQPDADHGALAELRERERGIRRRQLLARR